MKLFTSLTACSVFAAVAGVTLPANAIDFFSDRTTFENSLGGATTFNEDFNSTPTQTFTAPFSQNLGDLTIGSTDPGGTTVGIFDDDYGQGGTPNIDGTNFFGLRGPNTTNSNFTLTFATPRTAVGFDFDDSDFTDAFEINLDGQTLSQSPFETFPQANTPVNGFFGVIADSPFTEVEITQVASGGFVAGVGVDNVVSAEPIPFEAEGTMGLVALGSYLYYRKKRSAKA